MFVLIFACAVNILDRHVERHPDKTALIWERDEQGDFQTITYKCVTFKPMTLVYKLVLMERKKPQDLGEINLRTSLYTSVIGLNI